MKKIKNTLKLFKLDWERIFKNPIATFLIISLMVIPSLYAWFNIKALWDPYSNTGELPIAVYSDDQTASFQGKKINIGKDVLENLHENKQLGWRFVHSKKELDDGVKSGKYYAGIYLPKDFSKDLLSFTTGDIVKPKIEYTINEKINAIAPKITDKGATSLQTQISDEFIKTASSTLMSAFNEVGYNIDSNLVSINKVKHLVLSTDASLDDIDKYSQEVMKLHGQMPELKNKLAKANEFAEYLPQVDALGQKIIALNKNMPELTEQAKIILTLQEKIPEIQNAGNQLAMIDEDFDSVAQTMIDGIDEAKQGLEIIKNVQLALPDIQNLGNQADELSQTTLEGAAKLKEALPSISSSIKVTIQAISTIGTSVASVVEQLKDNRIPIEEREQLKQELAANLGQQQQIVVQLSQTLTQLQETAGNQSLQGTIDQLNNMAALIGTVKTRVDAINVNLVTDDELDAIQAEAMQIVEMVNRIDVDSVGTTIDTLLTQLISTLDTAQGLLKRAQQIDFENLLKATEGTITNAIIILEKYQAELPAIKQEVHDASVLLNGHMDKIVSGINKGADLYTNDLPIITEKLSTAADFLIDDYPGIKEDVTSTLTMVNQKMPQLEAALDKATNIIANDWPQLKSGIRKAAAAIRKGEQNIDLGEVIKLLKLDATAESDFFTEPVEISEKALYPIANNGSASTPFYTALCLWVGAVLFSSIATTNYYLDPEDKGKYSKREQFSARMLTFLVMGLAQALIVTLGNYFLLGVDVKNPIFSILFALLVALTFMMMVYVLVSLFGNIGKGIAIIILVLSISGGGGNYPIQVSGKFFQFINPLLPFTHAVDLLRESAGGIYWPNACVELLILCCIFVAFYVLGTYFYPSMEEKTKKLERLSHESKIFH